ncbi:MAG: hypothetical protein LUQ16_00180 [Methanomassiliicoccales archaeon]|nr:hypothetical protein [Methanomassiliicoccales archaeon]
MERGSKRLPAYTGRKFVILNCLLVLGDIMIPWAVVENGIRRVPASRELQELTELERDGIGKSMLTAGVIALDGEATNERATKEEFVRFQDKWLRKLGGRILGSRA